MINTILLIINLLGVSIITYFANRKLDKISSRMAKENEALFDATGNLMLEIKEIKDELGEYHKEMKDITTSPNSVKPANIKTIPLSEDEPWQIPQDVKVEVEGGDTNIPYSYGS